MVFLLLQWKKKRKEYSNQIQGQAFEILFRVYLHSGTLFVRLGYEYEYVGDETHFTGIISTFLPRVGRPRN